MDDIVLRYNQAIKERDEALLRLRIAKQAIISTGYFSACFSANEIGDDIAPRIIELNSYFNTRKGELISEAEQVRKQRDEARRELAEVTEQRGMAFDKIQSLLNRVAELTAVLEQLKDYFDLGEYLFAVSKRFGFARDMIEKALATDPAPIFRGIDLASPDGDVSMIAEVQDGKIISSGRLIENPVPAAACICPGEIEGRDLHCPVHGLPRAPAAETDEPKRKSRRVEFKFDESSVMALEELIAKVRLGEVVLLANGKQVILPSVTANESETTK